MVWISCLGRPHCLRHVLHPQPAGVLRASDQRRHSGLVISIRLNPPRAAV